MRQLTTDWEARFASEDTPWEDDQPWHGLDVLFGTWVRKGASVLDVGCGYGTNARKLSDLGYRVLAVDVSPTAVAPARAEVTDDNCEFRVADFLEAELPQVDVVFDRGCFHSYADHTGRSLFVQAAWKTLRPHGLWISVSGSVDNGETREDVLEDNLPRLSAMDIISAAEPRFELLTMNADRYGSMPGATDFRAFVSVFGRRD